MDWDDAPRITVVNTNPNHNPGTGPYGPDDATLEKERSRNSFRYDVLVTLPLHVFLLVPYPHCGLALPVCALQPTNPSTHTTHSEFIRTFRKGGEYVYRTQLLQRFRRGQLWVEVDLGHLHDYEPRLLKHLQVCRARLACRGRGGVMRVLAAGV